jgi:hypothetical protein
MARHQDIKRLCLLRSAGREFLPCSFQVRSTDGNTKPRFSMCSFGLCCTTKGWPTGGAEGSGGASSSATDGAQRLGRNQAAQDGNAQTGLTQQTQDGRGAS